MFLQEPVREIIEVRTEFSALTAATAAAIGAGVAFVAWGAQSWIAHRLRQHRMRRYIQTLFNSELRDRPRFQRLLEEALAEIQSKGYADLGISYKDGGGEAYERARELAAGLLTPREIDRITALADALSTTRVLASSFFEHSTALTNAVRIDAGQMPRGVKDAALREARRYLQLAEELPSPPIPKLKDLRAEYTRVGVGDPQV